MIETSLDNLTSYDGSAAETVNGERLIGEKLLDSLRSNGNVSYY